jgi:phenylalanyl-tRNA synthetase beta chain
LGTVFLAGTPGQKPDEFQRLGLLLSGEMGSGQWNDSKRGVDFWDAKGLMELVADSLGVEFIFSREGTIPTYLDPAESSLISRDGIVIGHLGLLSRRTKGKLGLKESGGRVFVCEIGIDNLPADKTPTFREWSNYPGVTRDLAIVLDQEIPATKVLDVLKADRSLPLIEVTIFDLYQGDKIPSGKKSLAMRLFFQDSNRTLTDELVNGYFNTIVESLKELLNAGLRS